MKRILVTGKTSQARTGYILDELEKRHDENCFSYLLIGPSTFFIQTVRDQMIERGKMVPAKQFMTATSLSRSLAARLIPERKHVNERYRTLEIARIYEEIMGYTPTLRTINYFNEAITVLKENLEDEEAAFGRNSAVPEILRTIFNRLKESFASKNVYDSYDALTMCAERLQKTENGLIAKTLFIDGFSDFTPLLKIFLSELLPAFNEVYLSCPQDPLRNNLFTEVNTIKSLLGSSTTEVIELNDGPSETLKPFKDNLFLDLEVFTERECENIDIVQCNDTFGELDYVARKIKQLVAKGMASPDQIEVVVPDDYYFRSLRKRLTGFGIPMISDHSMPVLESRGVQQLLLPLEVTCSSFSPRKILSMVDAGYAETFRKGKISPSRFEQLAASAKILSMQPQNTSDNARKAWLDKLNDYRDFLKNKIESLKAQEDYEDDSSARAQCHELQDRITFIEEAMLPSIKKLFSHLEALDKEGEMSLNDFEQHFRQNEQKLKLINNLEQARSYGTVADNHDCVKFFLDRSINDHNRMLSGMGVTKCKAADYYRSLLLFLESETARSDVNMSGGVQLFSLVKSRFTRKKVKFFIGFVEGNYPSTALNPLYAIAQYSKPRARDILSIQEDRQKLGLYLALLGAEERVVFTFAETNADGETLIRSPYIRQLLKASGKKHPEIYGRHEGKRSDLIPVASEALSLSDWKLAIASLFRSNPEEWKKHADDLEVTSLDKRLKKVSRVFDFRIENNDLIKDPAEGCISFSRLSSYCSCKFKYYLNYVLRIEAFLDEKLELSPMDTGSIFHAVLSDYYGPDHESLENSLKRHLRKLSDTDSSLLFKMRYRHMLKTLQSYLNFEAELEKKERRIVVATELPFGIKDSPPLQLTGDLCLRGVIDRIDEGQDSEKLFVIDYKSGKSPSSAYPEQIVLYAMACEQSETFKGKQVSGGEFRLIRGKTNKKTFSVKHDESGRKWVFDARTGFLFTDSEKKGTMRDSELVESLERVIQGISSLDFAQSGWNEKKANCYKCVFEDICKSTEWMKKDGRGSEQ